MLIEYCDGGAVDSIMVELEKALTESQISYVCQQMTKGLAFLHKSRVIHRDLKAGNVLLTMAGGVKLGKFFNVQTSQLFSEVLIVRFINVTCNYFS